MARVTGLEPATSGVTGRRSNQLSYTRTISRKAVLVLVSPCIVNLLPDYKDISGRSQCRILAVYESDSLLFTVSLSLAALEQETE